MPVIGQKKLLEDGTIAVCTATSGATGSVSYIAEEDAVGRSDLMSYAKWDSLRDWETSIGTGRSGETVYSYARRIAFSRNKDWVPWELLSLAERRIWNDLVNDIDHGRI